nr:MAG TPA: hypothetical protein [Caudoviricetes sp.]
MLSSSHIYSIYLFKSALHFYFLIAYRRTKRRIFITDPSISTVSIYYIILSF